MNLICFFCTAGRVHRLLAASVIALITLTACETTPPAGPSPDALALQQRTARAKSTLQAATKSYDAGTYDDALRGYLTALDSGLLTAVEQIDARKHLAFIHCINNRETSCKDQFEKVLVLDPAFLLSAAESGHPSWGPVFKQVKLEDAARKSGTPLPAAPMPVAKPAAATPVVPPPPPPVVLPSLAKNLLNAGIAAYEAGEYPKALKGLQDALKESPSLDYADQIKARKYSAFSYCLTNRATLCRTEFEQILTLNPDFVLSPAEAGHPSWGPSFRAAKARVKPAAPPAKKP